MLAWLVFAEDLLQAADCPVLISSHDGKKAKALWGPFYKALISFMRPPNL